MSLHNAIRTALIRPLSFLHFQVFIVMAAAFAFLGAAAGFAFAEDGSIQLSLRYQQETSPDSGRYHRLLKQGSWSPSETAVIVCDMWDSHHCVNAVRRAVEMAPRADAMLTKIRSQGAVIIHAPSGCMNAYEEAPARKRAQAVKPAADVPSDIAKWCDQIPSEASAAYPLDQSAGGEDDDLLEHAAWAARLAADGRNPRAPWRKQMDMLHIDQDKDYISDSGPEIWSILNERGIKHVILIGVHTNMCVLGRPFGLRQLAEHGRQVVLMRDLTDTMYDPRQWPFVSHFTGTDLIVDHIERYVCSTITSDMILGGKPFRFASDKRPELAIIMAEDEYHTERSLPPFAMTHLGLHFRLQFIYGSAADRADLPGLDQIRSADALLVSVRRRPLAAEQLKIVREFVASGKPVIGIRTASHAFCLRDKAPENGLADWPEFDKEVFGGSYTNHYRNDAHPRISRPESVPDSPNLPKAPFVSQGSLYKVSPLAAGTTVLLEGAIEGEKAEPVAWTAVRSGGGRSFYTSLGHEEDFKSDEFRLLLVNGIHWACDLPLVHQDQIHDQRVRVENGKGKQR